MMEDLTIYTDDELSLRVFNEEPLYLMRGNRAELFLSLQHLFVYTKLQEAVLLADLEEDS